MIARPWRVNRRSNATHLQPSAALEGFHGCRRAPFCRCSSPPWRVTLPLCQRRAEGQMRGFLMFLAKQKK